jgi:hypothetical protein
MSLNVNGLDELKLRLQRLKGVPLAANAELKILAEETAALARRMAPVDKEKLEEAIKVRFEGTERNALGRFVTGGGAYTVFVDNSVPVEGRKGKTVGDYAWEMHEHLTPAGPMKLGALSVEKQAGSNVVVGGKFLERAGEEMRDQIPLRLAKIVFVHIEGVSLDN